MKKLYISESERIEILKKHNSKLLSEADQVVQQTNYTISDLQNALVKAGQNPGKVDGQFGPATLGAAEKAIGGTATPATTASTTPNQVVPAVTSLETKKVTSLKTDGGKVTGVETTNVGGGGSTSSSSL
jgi:hypothetical protein